MPQPTRSSLSPFQQFKRRWEHCGDCDLREVRKTAVLCRGRLPCTVLFVGEAPGISEDSQGEPFVGPAGGLLDQIICEALRNAELADLNPVYPDWWRASPVRLGWTNIICCIPKVEGVKAGEPPQWAVKACAPRLRQFLAVAKPQLVVMVGDHSAKWVPIVCDEMMDGLQAVKIVHPARLLRLRTENPSWATIEYRRAVVTLTDAFEILSQETG
jgi:uracil-DNA glycosylase